MKSPVYVTALQDLWIWEDVLDVSYKCCAFLQYIILPKKKWRKRKNTIKLLLHQISILTRIMLTSLCLLGMLESNERKSKGQFPRWFDSTDLIRQLGLFMASLPNMTALARIWERILHPKDRNTQEFLRLLLWTWAINALWYRFVLDFYR